MKLNLFNSLILRLYHRWRAFLRDSRVRRLSDSYAYGKHRLIPAPEGKLIIPTLYGFEIAIDSEKDRIQGHSIYYNGSYEPGTLYIMSHYLSSGDCFVDVGSNLGLMSLYASKCVGHNGKVFAFEPEPETFEMLKMNTEINDCRNIVLFPFALGSSKGNVVIHASESNRGASSLMQSEKLTGNASEVKIERLDEVIRRENVDLIRMIKIDVEGWELEVLKGSRSVLDRTNAPVLCVECSKLHPMCNGKPDDLFAFITEINDYQIYRLVRGKERKSKLIRINKAAELPEHDNIFCFLPAQKKEKAFLFAD